jgi:hypothetical protein
MTIKSLLAATAIAGLGFFSLGTDIALAQQTASINASTLPTSRTTTVGTPITIFATIANAGPGTATGCSIGLQADQSNGGPNPAGLSVAYRAFEADNATPAAPEDTPVDIAEGANQAFVLSVKGSGPFNQEIAFDFTCDGGNTRAPSFSGVNTLLLLNGTTASPDIITIGTSPTKDAVIRIPTLGAGEIMAVAAVNIGSGPVAPDAPDGISRPATGANGAPVIVVPDFGENVDLALQTFICETDPATAQCLAPYASTVRATLGDQPSTFNVFVNSNLGAGVPLYADIARQYVRFYQDTSPPPVSGKGISKPAQEKPADAGNVYGATSHAVTSPGPAATGFNGSPHGIWQIVYDTEILDGFRRDNGFITVTVEGEWIGKVLDTENGDVFQFGFLSADTTGSGDPTLSLEFTNYEDISNDPNGSQSTTSYQGSGTWQPKSFMQGNVRVLTPPDKGISGPAITNNRNANYRALYSSVYDRTVTFASLAGIYDLFDTQGGNTTPTDNGDVTIAADGTFTGFITPEAGQNCVISGALTEYGNGKNLFGVEFTIANCALADSFRGQGFQFDNDLYVEGTIIPNIFAMLVSAGNSDLAVEIDLIPRGNVVLSQN